MAINGNQKMHMIGHNNIQRYFRVWIMRCYRFDLPDSISSHFRIIHHVVINMPEGMYMIVGTDCNKIEPAIIRMPFCTPRINPIGI